MSFLSYNEAFKEYAQAIIVGVYSDKITASVVRKENAGVVIVATAVEQVENIPIHDGMVDTEKIVFNMEKAIMALPAGIRVPATPVIIALGSKTGSFAYETVQKKREARERKITAEELQTLVTLADTEKGNAYVYKNYPEHFSIDGFSVSDPVGVNGEEIVAGMVRVSCDASFKQECASRIAALGLRLCGMIDMRYAAARGKYFFEKSANALVLLVFENETYAVLMREKAVHAVGVAHVGYGILYADIARTFSVGYEEAKAIVRAYRKGELDDRTKTSVETAIAAAAQNVVDAAQEMIAHIDLANIIPGNVHIVCADGIPEILARFVVGDWLVHLPIERNAAVHVFPEEKTPGFSTPFDRMAADFLLGHH